jgi:hypothetical protein
MDMEIRRILRSIPVSGMHKKEIMAPDVYPRGLK